MTSCRNRILALLLAVSNCGCASVWYELQPHRLKKLNNGPPPSLSPEFTSQSPSQQRDAIRRVRQSKPAIVSANSAEVAMVRAQNPDWPQYY